MSIPTDHIQAPATEVAQDTATALADTLAQSEGAPAGIVLMRPAEDVPIRERPVPPGASSWVTLVVIGVFVLVCLRFRNNFKYFHTLISSLTDVRERSNAFDDTVRESVFMVLLNILGAVSMGMILFVVLLLVHPAVQVHSSRVVMACILVMLVYSAVMPLLYWATGRIFTDRRHTTMWLQGYGASNALIGMGLLPFALVGMFYPGGALVAVIAAAVIYVLVKLIFIFKGLRIFITHFSSWVVFLYYLCSLEVVPLVLAYASACVFGI